MLTVIHQGEERDRETEREAKWSEVKRSEKPNNTKRKQCPGLHNYLLYDLLLLLLLLLVLLLLFHFVSFDWNFCSIPLCQNFEKKKKKEIPNEVLGNQKANHLICKAEQRNKEQDVSKPYYVTYLVDFNAPDPTTTIESESNVWTCSLFYYYLYIYIFALISTPKCTDIKIEIPFFFNGEIEWVILKRFT